MLPEIPSLIIACDACTYMNRRILVQSFSQIISEPRMVEAEAKGKRESHRARYRYLPKLTGLQLRSCNSCHRRCLRAVLVWRTDVVCALDTSRS
jgi:hypothetical protein